MVLVVMGFVFPHPSCGKHPMAAIATLTTPPRHSFYSYPHRALCEAIALTGFAVAFFVFDTTAAGARRITVFASRSLGSWIVWILFPHQLANRV